MVDRDIFLLLIGAGIALISSIATTFINHWLSLRADKIKRLKDKEEKETENRKAYLLQGVGDRIAGQKLNITIGDNATNIAAGKGLRQKFTDNTLETISDQDLVVLHNLFQALEKIIKSQSPPEKTWAAIERISELEEAILSKKPDLTSMEYVKRWFGKNIPELEDSVVAILVNPIVGKVVNAKITDKPTIK